MSVIKLIIDIWPYPIIVVDLKGQIIKLNKASQKCIESAHPEQVIVDILYNDRKFDKKRNFVSPLLETLETGKEFVAEIVTIFYNNRSVDFLINTLLLKDEFGNTTGACGLYLKVPLPKFLKLQVEMLAALAKIIDAKCKHTKSHSDRVGLLSLLIAKGLNLSRHQQKTVYLAALLHDIGKIGITEKILHKKTVLTEDEYQIIQQHPVVGAKMLESISFFKDLVPVVYHHHEHFDGNGYPGGLTGDKIPMLSRIITVADAFEAMTSERCYRKKLNLNAALREIYQNSGSQFDPDIVKVFVDIIREELL